MIRVLGVHSPDLHPLLLLASYRLDSREILLHVSDTADSDSRYWLVLCHEL